MDFITLNNKRIRAAECDFNFVAMLSENGIELNQISKKMIPTVRVYVAHCMGVDVETAGDYINQHIISGGTLEQIMETLSKKFEDSGFFRAISESKTENIEESEIKEVESTKVTPMKKSKTNAE